MMLKPSPGTASGPEWIKSSYSAADDPACVEVAAAPSTIRVRDSKNPQGPQLTFPTAPWATFTQALPGAAHRLCP
ncbi:DUF397 domain-containing protein [Streptomyces sp. NPDC052396]|uniref:DUF397 domain-containing protein n=1 Tax=Streptomyces sp. NPDC052396 TaxID=3365689 RepID=UPI0037D07F25